MSEVPQYVEKLCRLCLSHPDGGEMVNIFEKSSPNEQIIANRIFECVAIKVRISYHLAFPFYTIHI